MKFEIKTKSRSPRKYISNQFSTSEEYQVMQEMDLTDGPTPKVVIDVSKKKNVILRISFYFTYT